MLTKEELRKLDIPKLLEEAYKAKRDLFQIKFKVKSGQSKELHKINNLKRYIARVKTIQHSKQIQVKEIEKPTETAEEIEKTK